MSTPVTAVLIGAGQRGAKDYAPYALQHPERLRFVAVAEPDGERRLAFARDHAIPPENQFEDWRALLDRPQMGQAALICTQDQMHVAPTLKALSGGYDVLLEKPMATTPAECRALVVAAAETGRQLHVCHVLRYTRHFQMMQQIVQSGMLGEVIDANHRENVSFWHMAHSFVRGNWADEASSAPMILAKCCHDFDILLWILDQQCERLSSFGSLTHFRPDRAPEGAPYRCLDGCPAAESCPYYAPYVYVELGPLWHNFADSAGGAARIATRAQLRVPGLVRAASTVVPLLRQVSDYRGWPRTVVAHDASPDSVMEALRTGPYGRCVYHCDNSVVDHQAVMMEFASGTTVTLTMHGHSAVEGRTTRIEGSRAELRAFLGLGGSWIEVQDHRSGRRRRYNTSPSGPASHGGGDQALMASFVSSIQLGDVEGRSTARQALESHLLAFAAERSRLEGTVLSRADWQE